MFIKQNIQIVTYTGEDQLTISSSLSGMGRVTKIIGLTNDGRSQSWLSTSLFNPLKTLEPQESYLVYSDKEAGEDTFTPFNLIDSSDGIPMSVLLDKPVQFAVYCGQEFDLNTNDFVPLPDDPTVATTTTTTPAPDDWQHRGTALGSSVDEFFGGAVGFTQDDAGIIIGRPSAELSTDSAFKNRGGFSFHTLSNLGEPSTDAIFSHINIKNNVTEFGKHVAAFDDVDNIYVIAAATGRTDCISKWVYDKSTQQLSEDSNLSVDSFNISAISEAAEIQAAYDLSVSRDLSVVVNSNPFAFASGFPRGKVFVSANRYDAPLVYDNISISGSENDAQFGKSIAVNAAATYLTEATIAVGSPRATNNSLDKAGGVQVYSVDFTNNGTVSQLGADLATVTGFTPIASAFFGSKVAISGDGLVVAASEFDPATARGAVHIFSWTGSAWVFQTTLTNGIDFEYFGEEIKLNHEGDALIIGSPSAFPHGKVQLFYDASGAPNFTYTQLGRTLRPSAPSGASTNFGKVTVSNRDFDLLAVGYDHNSTGITNDGAVDIYTLNNSALPTPAPTTTTAAPPTITISSQPQDVTVAANISTTSFNITATASDGGTVNYQWYKKRLATHGIVGGSTYAYPEIVGGNSSSLTLTGLTASDDGAVVYCKVSRQGALVQSSDAEITKIFLSITNQPNSTNVYGVSNPNTSFSVFVEHGANCTVSYQWQYKSGSSFVDIPNSNNSIYDTAYSGSPAPAYTYHRCVISLIAPDGTTVLTTATSDEARHTSAIA